MSARNIQENTLSNKILKTQTLKPNIIQWSRNPSWLTLPPVTTSDQKFIGLVAVFPDADNNEASNFISLSAADNYTVDWGDGVVENYSANVQCYHAYDFNNASLNNTNAPVTLIDSGDIVQRTLHGYANGEQVRFYNIVSTTGLTEGQVYYVINSNINDFQVSSVIDGPPITLTTNGSATLLPYKQAILIITPQAGQNLTNVNIDKRHNQASLGPYNAPWLDIRTGSPNFTSLTLGTTSSSSTVYIFSLEQVELVNTGAMTSFASLFINLNSLRNVIIGKIGTITSTSSMFQGCRTLQSVPFFDTSNVTNMQNMFLDCRAITSVPLFDTSNVTNMQSMFGTCQSLIDVPLFNTAKVTTMQSMFSSCAALTSAPLFNTSSVTNMTSMFSSCTVLTSVPLFDTSSVTNMSNMFLSCSSLKSVPLFNTAKVTNMTSMFSSCWNLKSIPFFNTASVTSMNSTFSTCFGITSQVPLFNTANVTDMSSMFNGCQALTDLPAFNTSSATATTTMLNTCYSLTSVPALNLSTVSSGGGLTNMFANSRSISEIKATGARFSHSIGNLKLSKTALKKYMDNLGTIAAAGQTLTISGNWGIGSNTTKTITSTAQSTTVSCADTSNLSTGMMMTGTGTGINGVSVTSDVTANTLTLNNHGLPNGTRVSFSALGTTTGVSTNTIYYVVNSATNTFQISLTAGGGAIDLTGSNATMTLRYPNYITSINPNVSVTLDVPAASSQTNASWIFRTVDSYGALLRGWAVTY